MHASEWIKYPMSENSPLYVKFWWIITLTVIFTRDCAVCLVIYGHWGQSSVSSLMTKLNPGILPFALASLGILIVSGLGEIGVDTFCTGAGWCTHTLRYFHCFISEHYNIAAIRSHERMSEFEECMAHHGFINFREAHVDIPCWSLTMRYESDGPEERMIAERRVSQSCKKTLKQSYCDVEWSLHHPRRSNREGTMCTAASNLARH